MFERTEGRTYEQLRAGFRWKLPERLNIAVECCDRQLGRALALIELDSAGARRDFTFEDLRRMSNRFANGLRGLGVRPGDRVAVMLAQRAEAGLAHLALYKLGAIAVPVSILFGPDALGYRLADCRAGVVITDMERLPTVCEVGRELEQLQVIVVDGQAEAPHRGFWELVRDASDRFEAAATSPDTPALLIYTSGTTGPPKGAVHAHRSLLGHLPGFELSHNYFPQAGDRFWTPADWAWIGGLMDALMPTWYYGRPIVAAARRAFDPEWALWLISEMDIRNAFLPPTALKLMRSADVPSPRLSLRSVMSGGESLGDEMLAWGRDHFGITINEIYGQTEANYVVGNSAGTWAVRPGSMGRAYPGHDVAVVGPAGEIAAAGEIGEIAVRAPDPVLFLEYWNQPEATQAKYTGDGRWLRTGDLAHLDEDGYFWFQSRADDVINSAGYRIGPDEIEECLVGHRAVAMAAVVGVPDALRGQAVKAFIQLAGGYLPSPDLEEEIRGLVRSRLAAYEYPRQIEFVDQLPLTITGKIRRAELRRREADRARTAAP